MSHAKVLQCCPKCAATVNMFLCPYAVAVSHRTTLVDQVHRVFVYNGLSARGHKWKIESDSRMKAEKCWRKHENAKCTRTHNERTHVVLESYLRDRQIEQLMMSTLHPQKQHHAGAISSTNKYTAEHQQHTTEYPPTTSSARTTHARTKLL